MVVRMARALALAMVLCGCGHVTDETEECSPDDACECETPEPVRECDPDAPLNDKAKCDDGIGGTADRCVPTPDGGAVCAHVYVMCDGYAPQEEQALMCDDLDPCTVDGCLVSACVHGKIANCTVN